MVRIKIGQVHYTIEYAKTSGRAIKSSPKWHGVAQGWSLGRYGTVLELLITTTSNEGSTRRPKRKQPHSLA